MNKFLDISSADHPDRAFDLLLAESGLHDWRDRDHSSNMAAADHPSGQFPHGVEPVDHVSEAIEPWRVLVGIATWNRYDLRMLDVLDEWIRTTHVDRPTVYVFSIAGRTSEELARLVPGVAVFLHTPTVSIWQDGVLTQSASGKAARDIIAAMCGTTSDEIVRFIDHSRNAAYTG